MVWSLRLKGLGSGKQPLSLVESEHGKHVFSKKSPNAPRVRWMVIPRLIRKLIRKAQLGSDLPCFWYPKLCQDAKTKWHDSGILESGFHTKHMRKNMSFVRDAFVVFLAHHLKGSCWVSPPEGVLMDVELTPFNQKACCSLVYILGGSSHLVDS